MRDKDTGQMNTSLPGLDENAFCRLYDNCREDLFRYAFYRLGSREEAEDAVQDCVLDAWRGLAGLRSIGAFRGWIFKILSACCSRRISRIVREREKVSAAGMQDLREVSRQGGQMMADADPAGEQTIRSMALSEALAQLTGEEREIVLLSVVAGFSSAEIAEQTGLQPGSVRSKLSRSLAKMREYLT